MEADAIRSYLVGLGFVVDNPSFSAWKGQLKASENLVKGATSGILLDFLKWQIAITGVFTGVTAAILGAADKASSAETEYRLMGERMFMTTEQAKRMKIALDALGQPLEAVAWDPELHQRYVQLIRDQERLQTMLGPDYARQMRAVRDMRFELTRMQVVAEYLGMKLLSDIFKGLGLGDGNVLQWLQDRVEWLMVHGPALAQRLADTLVPVMRETWDIVKDLGEVFRLAGVAFVNLVGIISGDSSLEGTTLTFEKMAGSVQHVIGWLSVFLGKIIDAEKLTIHLLTAVELAKEGKGSEARTELRTGLSELNAGSGSILGMIGGGMIGGGMGAALGIEGGPLGMLAGSFGGAGLGVALGGGLGAGLGAVNPYSAPNGGRAGAGSPKMSPLVPGGTGAAGIAAQARPLALAASRALGVPADVIYAQWAHETGGFTNRGARSLNNLAGMTDGRGHYLNFGSPEEFASYYVSQIRKNYGGAIGAQSIEDFATGLHNGRLGSYFEANLGAYERGMRGFRGAYGGGGVTIGSITIPIMQPNATPGQITAAVADGIDQRLGRQTTRNLAELGGGYAYP